METVIYFVRHGEVDNPQDIFYGRLPGYALSPLGRMQIQKTAAFLATKSVSLLYASKLLRAKQSAQIIQETLHIPKIHFTDEILEIETSFQGRTFVEAHAINDNVFASPESGITGETIEQIADRGKRFITEIFAGYQGKHIAAVSHGDVLMIMRAWINGLPLVNESLRPKDGSYIKNGEVYAVTRTQNGTFQFQSVFCP